MGRWIKRLVVSSGIAMSVMLLLSLVVLAAPNAIADFVGISTDTRIYLTWDRDSTGNTTVIKHSTSGYPSTPASGTSTYNGTAEYTTLSGLAAGTTYYFSAWAYDGSDYSSVTNLVVSTLPSITDNTSIPIDQPTIPAEVVQNPDISGWSIYPLDEILNYFADPSAAHGGLGMPVNNVVMFLSGFGVTFVSIGTYVKWRSFFTSWFILLILCVLCSAIGIMQWIIVGFLLLIGALVMVVENRLQ